jgi:Family of unknown function (DUF5701)
MAATTFDPAAEFDRQVAHLLHKGYPALAGLSAGGFCELVQPLRAVASRHAALRSAPTPARVPFALVVTQRLVPAHASMPLTELNGKPGFVSADTADIDRFVPIEQVAVPASNAYLVLDVERGAEFRNVRPDDALLSITERGRTPLTVDEGIALVTLHPQTLEKNHCFSLLASRCGDRRVPALWISKGAPKLGWCWAGNPHTWLGSASCGNRIGPVTA